MNNFKKKKNVTKKKTKNMEHTGSLMSPRLSSVILPFVLEGDIVPPYKQTNLSLDEIREKEAQVIFLSTC